MKEDKSPFLTDQESGASLFVAADAETVRARKWSSDFVGAFRALMKAAGIAHPAAHNIFVACVDAARLCEESAEAEGRPAPQERSFQASNAEMALYLRAERLPKDEPQRERRRAALDRHWRRYWPLAHAEQCRTQYGFIIRDSGGIVQGERQSSTYTDRLTDLIVQTVKLARAKRGGNSISKMERAAIEVLAEFRATFPPYAPEINAPEPALKDDAGDSSSEVEAVEADPLAWLKPVRARAARLASDTIRLVRERQLTPDEDIAVRRELLGYMERLLMGEPLQPDGDGGGRGVAVPPVIRNTDTYIRAGAKAASSGVSTQSPTFKNTEENSKMSETTTDNFDRNARPSPLWEATRTIEAFSSVGATGFKVFFGGIYPLEGEAEKMGSEPEEKGASLTTPAVLARLPVYLRRNEGQLHNVAIRAWGPIIQVDDCSRDVMERLKPFAFYVVQTSPGNWQAWLALPASFVGADGKRNGALIGVRDRLLKKFKQDGESANGGAYGSTRLPGTLNIKEKFSHLPSFPRIRLEYVSLGRIVTPDELDAAGLLAPAPPPALRLVNATPRKRNIFAARPDHQYYVNRAPLKEDGRPDMNSADESFVIRLLSLGYSRAEAAAELRAARDKAARRPDYVERTLNAAENWLDTHAAPGRERAAI